MKRRSANRSNRFNVPYIFLILFAGLIGSFAQSARAQNGLVDSTFNSGSGPDGPITGLAIQPNGNLLITGPFSNYNGAPRQSIARIHPDGTLDGAFDVTTVPNSTIKSLALFPDGKLLVAGDFSQINGTLQNGMARLNPDGSVDTSFSVGAGVPQVSFLIQADGKILVGGFFQSIQGLSVSGLARLNNNGSVDTSFHPFPGLTYSQLSGFSLQPDGRILICGGFIRSVGQPSKGVARLLSDGSDDSSFQPPYPIATAYESGIYAQTDGKVLVVGYGDVNGQRQSILRLYGDGTLDTSFGAYFPWAIAAMPDPVNRVLVFGATEFQGLPTPSLIRLNVDGSRDWSFDLGAFSGASVIAFQSDGKLIIGGSFTGVDGIPRKFLARLHEYNPQSVFHFDVTSYNVSESNATVTARVIRGGPTNVAASTGFRTIAGTARPGKNYVEQSGHLEFQAGDRFKSISVVVLDNAIGPEADKTFSIILDNPSEGSIVGTPATASVTIKDDDALDLSFNPGIDGDVRAFTVQPDGKIVIAGNFTNIQGVAHPHFARLNTDGTLDTSFDAANQITLATRIILGQPDGRLIVTGAFTDDTGLRVQRILRLNQDGSLDLQFSSGAIVRENNVYELTSANKLVLQTDGKLLLYGSFAIPTQPAIPLLVRLNPDGSEDRSFRPNLGWLSNSVTAVAAQASGGILVGGSALLTTNTPLLRLLADGATDSTFDGRSLAGLYVRSLTIQPDDKVLIATGAYYCWSEYDNSPRLLRLNSDGTLDASFHEPGFGPFECHSVEECSTLALDAIAIQRDGRILVAGTFVGINGVYGEDHCFSRSVLARLNPDGSLDYDFDPGPIYSTWLFPLVWALGIEPDGRIVVAGAIASLTQANLIRFNSGAPLITQAKFEQITLSSNRLPRLNLFYEGSSYFKIEASSDFISWAPILTNREWRLVYDFIDSEVRAISKRFYRLRAW